MTAAESGGADTGGNAAGGDASGSGSLGDALDRLILADAFGADSVDARGPSGSVSAPGAAAEAGSGSAGGSAERVSASGVGAARPEPAAVLVVDDRSGALTLGALERAPGARVLVRCADALAARRVGALLDERPVAERDRVVLAGDETLSEFLGRTGARRTAGGPDSSDSPGAAATLHIDLALGRLPKSLRALDAIVRGLARTGSAETRLVLGGAVKHMSRSANEVLGTGFAEVRGLRGRGKHRCLEARTPLPDVSAHEPEQRATEYGTVVGLGGVFSSAKPDPGGDMLAASAGAHIGSPAGGEARGTARGGGRQSLSAGGLSAERPLRVLDLGCGNGSVSLAVSAAAERTGVPVALTAVDVDADATASARMTLACVRGATVLWDPHAGSLPDGSQDLVLLNPPFHDGSGVDASLAAALFNAAARVLDPGATLLVVFNSHLRYRPELERRFARVEQVARDRRFTVLSASDPRTRR